MGASCATGSKTTDPDKEPYGPSGKTKKGKGRREEPGQTKKADRPTAAAGSGREDAKTENQGRPPSQDQEEQDKSQKKISESSRSRGTDDDDDDRRLHEKRSSRGSSSADGAPSRPHSTEKKRDSREAAAATPAAAAAAEELPSPRKRAAAKAADTDAKQRRDAAEEKQREAAPRTRRRSPEVTSSSGGGGGPDGAKRRREPKTEEKEDEEDEKMGRKRSSLDNDFIVPVKVEAKSRGDAVSRREPKEGVKNEENVSRENRPEKKLQQPDLIQDSVVETKVDPKRRSTEKSWSEITARKDEPLRQKNMVIADPPELLRNEGIGSGRETGSRGAKPGDIKIDERLGRPYVLPEVPKQERVGVGLAEGVPSPRRKTVPGDFEITASGLTPIAPTATHQNASRSSVKDKDEKRKSGSGQIPSPAKHQQQQPVGETMAVFGAIRGLTVLKPGPDVVVSVKEQGSVSTATPVEEAADPVESSPSTGSHQPPTTHSATVPPTASINSVENSPTKEAVTAEHSPKKLQTFSDQTSPPKPVPAMRTTIPTQNKPEQTDTSTAKQEEILSSNGINSPTIASANELKPKADRSSKLPVKGSSSSTPISSPSISTSDSVNLSPVSPTPSSLPPQTTRPSDSTRRRRDSNRLANSADEIERTKSLLVDLSADIGSLMDARALCPGTRSKLLQAVDRWLAAGTEKERENNAARVMVVSGRPGIGKTCLAAEVCRRHSSQLAGVHFFEFQPRRFDQNHGRTMVLSIAAKMADVIPGYSEFLPTFGDLCQLIDEGELSGLFGALIVRPLQTLKNPDQRYLIVVDALDECCQPDRDVLLQLIGGFDKKTPNWVHLLCTVRDDNQLTGQLEQGVQRIELKGSSDAMTLDLKRYLRDPMSRLIDRISLDGALNELSQHSHGSFLAAYLLKRKLEGHADGSKLALRDVALFPSGLEDICREYFQRFYDLLSKKYSGKETIAVYSGVVGILALAKEKLSPEFVKQVHAGLDASLDLDPLRGLLDFDETGAIGLHHRSISEWLFSDRTSAPLAVTPGNARQRMSDAVLVWLRSILEVSASSNSAAAAVPTELVNYALRHAVEHLTDAPKNQDSIACLLCSLVFIERKLKVPGVSLEDLLGDYRHSHYQATGAASKLITLEAYMKRSADLAQQIESYWTFLRRRGDQIARHPDFILQFAANYSTAPRIQQNAQNDLQERPWLEDVTAGADTPSTCRQVSGVICQSDLSNDGRSIVVLTQHEHSVFLHLVNATTGEYTGDPLDITGISDCKGQCVRFLPDNNHLFVGSLSTFVSLKTWKPITSALDVQSLQMKENFAIECCDAVANILAFGINTLPWNGRTLHLGIYDLKTKKAKLLEVHSFRFGGSSQFGIKALALSADGSLASTCVKHQKKVELKVTVWSTATLKQLHAVDIENDTLTRCFFVGSQSLVISGGFATPDNHQLTYFWALQDKKAMLFPNSGGDNTSVAYARGTQLTTVHRYRTSSQFTVSRWRKEAGKQKSPDDRLLLRGLERLCDLIATEKSLVFLSRKFIQIYQFADLAATEETRSTPGSFALRNTVVEGVGFFPRSDDPVVVHGSSKASSGDEDGGPPDTVTVTRVSVKNDGLLLANEFFAPEKLERRNKGEEAEIRCFQGEHTSLNICSCTSDGAMVVVNYGSDVRVLDVASGAQRSIPKLAEVSKEQGTVASTMTCVLSTREPLVALMYSERQGSLFIFDLRSKVLESILELKSDPGSRMSDFAFIPTNGNVVTYHRKPDQSLVVWNQRTGATVSRQTGVDVVYVRQSPSSDRMVVSLRPPKTGSDGSLVLRNCDNRFNIPLSLPQGSGSVPRRAECGDVEFSADGTVLLGMFTEARVVRLWNIGNGEVLKDLVYLHATPTSELIGMATNTHALVSDGWMLHVIDVDSGDVVAVLRSADGLCPKRGGRGLRISPKGGLIAGSTESTAELRLFQCHGLAAVKRKTTLQLFRIK